MNRRQFIAQSTALAAATGAEAAEGQTTPAPGQRIIDCNLYLGHWPFRTLPRLSEESFAAEITRRGAGLAWVSSFDGIFHRDSEGANSGLARFCASHAPLAIAAGSINPKLPAWQDDLKRCARDHGMKLIRLHPNYHGYALDDPVFVKLLESAIRERLGVQIVAQMEDERTQHPLMQVKPVDFKPLPALLKSLPEARVMVLNASRAMSMTALAGSGVWLDIAMLEGLGGVGNLLKDWPRDRVVFGSNAPLFYWESARLKLQESELSASQMTAITSANAGAFLAR
jgi:predicted TIM-barrel fold metal-dependent hydrolase